MKFFLIIAGSRNYNNYEEMEKTINYLLKNQKDKEITIISGGCSGADSLAERYAKKYNLKCEVIKAEWRKYGKSAGYIRNKKMHEFIKDKPFRGCVCFWNETSKGTQQNFKLAKIYKTPLRVFSFKSGRFLNVA